MADAYDKLGLRLTYHPYAQPCILHAEAPPETGNKGKWSVSEGYAHPKTIVSWLVNSHVGAGHDRVGGSLDPAYDDRMCRPADAAPRQDP